MCAGTMLDGCWDDVRWVLGAGTMLDGCSDDVRWVLGRC